MKSVWLGTLVLALYATAAVAEDAAIDKVNGSIRVEAGQRAGDLSTVNGSVKVGDKSTVGSIDTVNGSIALGEDAVARELENVNGSITLSPRARIDGDVEAVNGSITLEKGVEVKGGLENVNGRIRLEAAHVAGQNPHHGRRHRSRRELPSRQGHPRGEALGQRRMVHLRQAGRAAHRHWPRRRGAGHTAVRS